MKQRDGYRKYKDIVHQASERWNIPPELVCAFCMTESSFEKDAKRYEPKFYDRYIKKMNLPEDEAKWRATSWGLMQIMGQVARESGYRGYREDLSDPAINLYYCCKLFARLLARYKGVKDDAIAAYNQGNNRWKDENRNGIKDMSEAYWNQTYVDKVLWYEREFKEIIDEESNVQTYVVQSGDTMTAIAKRFGVTVQSLAEMNGIANANVISVGAKLRVK